MFVWATLSGSSTWNSPEKSLLLRNKPCPPLRRTKLSEMLTDLPAIWLPTQVVLSPWKPASLNTSSWSAVPKAFIPDTSCTYTNSHSALATKDQCALGRTPRAHPKTPGLSSLCFSTRWKYLWASSPTIRHLRVWSSPSAGSCQHSRFRNGAAP